MKGSALRKYRRSVSLVSRFSCMVILPRRSDDHPVQAVVYILIIHYNM
jgi:hypothetical protein